MLRATRASRANVEEHMQNVRGTILGVSLVLAAVSAAQAPNALAQKPGGELTAGLYAGASSIDPHFSASYPSRTLLFGTYETLITVNNDGAPIPMLAERWEVSPDGLTFRFHLRHGVKFQNGKEMSAADVVASLNRYAKLSPERIVMAPVTGIEAEDPYTVAIKVNGPYPTFIDRLSSPASPCSIIPAEEAGKDINKTTPIGTGPFQMGEWVPGDHLVLTRFPGYTPYTAVPGPIGLGGNKHAWLDKVTLRVITESGSRVAALEAGQTQFAEDVPPQAAKRLRDGGKFVVQDLPTFQMPVIFLNFAAPPTDNLKVRQAMQAALDMSEVVAAAADNGPHLTDHALVWPGNAMHSDVDKSLYDQHDIEKAKSLLKEAGYHGEPVIFGVGTLGFMSRMGIVIAEELGDAGVNLKMQTMDLPTLLSAGTGDKGWNMLTNGFGSQPFLGAYAYQRILDGDFNVARVKSDPEMSALWKQFNTAADPAVRAEVFAKIQARVYEQVYFLKLGTIGMTYGIAPNVKGFQAWTGAARFWNVSLE
jgi:peptide/nickel transport system substrate-binding protein